MTIKRTILWIIGLYLVGSAIFLLSISLPATRQGLLLIQNGQRQLLTNPKKASDSFEQASRTFENSFSTLKDAPFLIKIATPLPPFRWQVRLNKAAQALAGAGDAAANMSSSFPAIDHSSTGDLAPLFTKNSQNYSKWYVQNQPQIPIIVANLHEADKQLSGIPYWIAFSERKNLAQLHEQVKTTLVGINEANQFGREIVESLGEDDSAVHSWGLNFKGKNSVVSYSLVADHGAITALNYDSTENTEGTITVSSGVLQKLTEISGPISLTDTSLATTPSVSEFLFKLYVSLGEKPGKFPEVIRVLEDGLQDGSITVEPTNPVLKNHLLEFLP